MRGEDVPVSIVKFIQSTYEGPPYKKIVDGVELKAGTLNEKSRGSDFDDSWVSLWLS